MAVAHAFDFDEFAPDKKLRASVSSGKIGKEKATIVLPETFMNKSGAAVGPLVTSGSGASAKANPKKAERLIVIYDDFQLPIGRVKISYNRSSGGHNGLESVIRAVKTEAFVRVRVGVAPSTAKGVAKVPHGDKEIEKFILSDFKKPEAEAMKKVAKKVVEAVEILVKEGRERAMSTINSRE